MTTITAHFDGQTFVPDEPVPPGLAPNTRVTILLNPAGTAGALEQIADLARPLGLPPDFAAQHDHYTKGLPKR